MKLYEKSLGWGETVHEGKMKNCYVTVNTSYGNKRWYFYLEREKDDLRYNCLWDEVDYPSIDECRLAAEKWIKENG